MGLFTRFKRSPKAAEITEKESDSEKVGAAEAGIEAQLPVMTASDPAGGGALDVMADHIYRESVMRGWFTFPSCGSDQWADEVITGVSIRSKYGAIRSSPFQHQGLHNFEEAVIQLNCRVAIKMTCKAVQVAMSTHV